MAKSSFLNIITFVFLFSNVCAQDFGEISYSVYKQITINNNIELYKTSGSFNDFNSVRSTLFNSLGTPIKNDCKIDFVGSTCEFWFTGLQFNYVDVGDGLELSTLILTSAESYLKYGSNTYKIGDNISELGSLSYEAYQKRGLIESDGQNIHAVRVNVNDSIANIIFEFDPSTKKITSIKLLRVIT